MTYRSLIALQADLLAGATSSIKVVQDYLEAINTNKELNAFIEVFDEDAITRAQLLDKKIQAKEKLGDLFGLVIGIKDNIVFKNHKATAGSKILQGYTSVFSATVIDRLLEQDAIIIGRLNCDEFAMGSSSENTFYGNVQNPYNKNKVPGGSSGGSAAAVAAGLCTAALGSDTGGSIRQPASFCGVVGLKPTYGRVSRYGLIAYGSSFDQIGPITNNVEDSAAILQVIAGSDDFDATSATTPVDEYTSYAKEPKKYKIGYYNEAINHPSIDQEVKVAAQKCIENLLQQGHQVEQLNFEEIDFVVPAYYVLTTAEASSNLSRFDGLRYGYSAPKATDLNDIYVQSRSQGFGWEVQRRIMCGTFVLSAGYYDAYYTKAQKVRRIIAEKTNHILDEFDFILCPAAPSVAFDIGQKSDDPIAMYLADIFTVQANIVGIPAICLPFSKDENGMPIGMQFMSSKFSEKKLLEFAYQFQQSL